MADDYLYAGEESDNDSDDGDAAKNDADEENAKDDAFLHAVCLKMFRAELEVYRQARQHGLDGIDVPRFISSVRVSESCNSKNCSTESSDVHGVFGILIQYLHGFKVRSLYDDISPPAPRSQWKHIVDEALRIVQYMTAQMDFCNKDCSTRNAVVHWDPVQERWKCKIIDFGHCAIRRPGVSEADWREEQVWEDEEGNMGKDMEMYLKERKGFDYVFERSQHSLDIKQAFAAATHQQMMAALKLK